MSLAIAAALLLQAAPAKVDPVVGEMRQMAIAMDAWKLCLLRTGKAWARQSAPPGDLADGAFGKCADKEQAVARIMLVSGIASDGAPLFSGKDVDAFTAKFRATWRPRVIAAILEERAGPRGGM